MFGKYSSFNLYEDTGWVHAKIDNYYSNYVKSEDKFLENSVE